MPCSFPLQSFPLDMVNRDSGKQSIYISRSMRQRFFRGDKMPDGVQGLPCGRCMPCRLERSRQTAMRALHESKMYDDNCFVTLTFSPEGLEDMCPLTEGGYSLVRKHTQDFMKKLREKLSRGFEFFDRKGVKHFYRSDKVRVLGCGEYGDDGQRPHYHFCLFNCAFPDRKYWKTVNGFKYYNSAVLSSLWEHGFSVIGDFSFETAAYVARYCTKKVTGDKAESHYKGRLPEFPVYSNRPGIGKPFFDKFGDTDIFYNDSCVVRGVECKVPRYYDKLREKVDPDGLAKAKLKRVELAKDKVEDNTFARLQVKEKCMNSRIKLLVRSLER